jgi:cyclopropane-fatty-acyl-phospholipid synthase
LIFWPGDRLAGWFIRRLNRKRLAELRAGGVEAQTARKLDLVRKLRESPRAIETDLANQQHYELPAAFFQLVLGDHLKYSSALFHSEHEDLTSAELAMLELYGRRAQLEDGQQILELGCGWGSLTLWMARSYPNARIVAVSNSHSQREFIQTRLAAEGLSNVEVRTENIVDLRLPAESFDRIVTVEMLEHVRNYREVFALLRSALKSGGKLFLHVFCHKHHPYLFDPRGGSAPEADWMERHFFSGGVMPSLDLYLYFADGLEVESQWAVNGQHYQRTALAWLQRMRAHKPAVRALFIQVYGRRKWRLWWVRWQLFFLACAELFGESEGEEWMLSHMLFSKA